MRRYVNYLDQKQFVRAMNQQFSLDAKDGSFATALVTTFFSPTRVFSICNAGHPRPFIYRAAEKAWSVLEHSSGDDSPNPSNIPLGIFDLADYEQFDIELNPGDMVLCYTDALTESHTAEGELLGEQRLVEMVRNVEIKDPRQFVGELLAGIEAMHPGNLAADDVTVLLLRSSRECRRVSWWEKLSGLGRMVSAVAANLRPHGRPPLPDLNLPNIGGAIIPSLSRRWRRIR
jgi:serine phosphatase RsbU (regulator of sigma subunit)